MADDVDHAKHIKTVFCDIDGCVFRHHGDIVEIFKKPPVLLPGVVAKFKEWSYRGYTIILTTGRPGSARLFTESQLEDAGLYFHHLIMGLPRGRRIVINDVKPNDPSEMAACVNVPRNKGLEDVDI